MVRLLNAPPGYFTYAYYPCLPPLAFFEAHEWISEGAPHLISIEGPLLL